MTDGPDTPDRHPAAVAALLAERLRRELHEFVRRAARPVTRDEAAAHAGISRRLAAFHLDKLVTGGLLQARADVPVAGVGRRPKVYEPGGVELAVSVPARHYDLLAELLLEAVEQTRGPTAEPGPRAAAGDVVETAAQRAAHQRGAEAGAVARTQTRPGRLGPERALTLAAGVLETCGYEPVRSGSRHVVLRNCPFHRLAERSRDLVCGINHAFCTGVVAGLDAAPGVSAALQPADGHCCVQLHA